MTTLVPSPTAPEMIRALGLKPHPEGGHYRETFRDPRQVEGRPASTAILFLLASGERSNTCNYLLTVCALSSTHTTTFSYRYIPFWLSREA